MRPWGTSSLSPTMSLQILSLACGRQKDTLCQEVTANPGPGLRWTETTVDKSLIRRISWDLVRKEGSVRNGWFNRDLNWWQQVGLGFLSQISHPLLGWSEALIKTQDKLGRSFPSQVWGQGQDQDKLYDGWQLVKDWSHGEDLPIIRCLLY